MGKIKQILLRAVCLCFGVALVCCPAGCRSGSAPVADFETRLLIDQTHPDCEGIEFGFEGGDLHKIGSMVHLVVNERFGEMVTANNRFGYWQSRDGTHWKRISTLLQFDYDTAGNLPNACIFSPRLVFSDESNRWVLFYIQFKSEPERTGPDGWYKRYDGRVMLCESEVAGSEGIAGPYGAGRTVFSKPAGGSWEGLQGITGFCPYQVDGKWFALYGSANTEDRPCSAWRLGVASADHLDGDWTPVSGIPLNLPINAEAPQVLKAGDRYYAVIDEVGGHENFSLLVSENGRDWAYSMELEFLDRARWSWKEVRTPIGFIQEGARFKTLFTTYTQTTDFAPIREMTFKIPKKNR